uniref:hypothetical protein n=1 Tax=Acetomicrobium sp. S15 = DSM 107314 TaxID=2529858 RepID=UPI001E4C094F
HKSLTDQTIRHLPAVRLLKKIDMIYGLPLSYHIADHFKGLLITHIIEISGGKPLNGHDQRILIK